MQTGIALTFLSVVAEEQFSLDELVLCVRQVMEQKGVPGMLRLILELLEFVDDVVDELGSRKEIEHVHTILERGTSADMQLEVYKETNDLQAVVDKLIEMTMENVPVATDFGTPHPKTTASTISK